jgi:prolyl-tRNA editing enzyme YbaK/EbsC (Cys-tRNA(Pro) deacylase)
MSLNEMEKIKSEFLRLDLHPTYMEHEAVITSVDAAKTRGFELSQGIKALLFTDRKEHFVVGEMK